MTTVTTKVKPEVETRPSVEHTRCECYYRPNVDIIEKDDELMLIADVPGVAGDNVDVDFEDGMLSIHAHVDTAEDEREYLINEYGVGDYCRSFQVDESIDAEKIKAECKNGILILHLPKTEAAKPRKILVKSS
jgi:HSP20 family molecular chaperone IbpA